MAWYDKYGILQKGRSVKNPGFLLFVISQIVVWIGIIPIFIIDIYLSLYHSICFFIYDMPRVPRKEYIVIDRGKLKGLNWYQKMECMYCGYANGVAARFKTIANITEFYSCAIKHKTKARGQEHQKDFYEYKEFS
jgi:hypothetical protein